MEISAISWTKSTFNPWMGCQRVSPACEHCYAEALVTGRMGYSGDRALWGPRAERRVTSVENWKKPRKWQREAELTGEFWPVFCASLADVFENRRDLDSPRRDLFQLIEETPHLTWLLLTKRSEHMTTLAPMTWRDRWPTNVWAGTTIEDCRRAAERLPHLLRVPAVVRFVSIEPQLESLADVNLTGIQWVITGGESGPKARHYDPVWAAETITGARHVGAAPFVKQMGQLWARANHAKHIHGADPREWAVPLRVQEFPDGLMVGRRPSAARIEARCIA